MMRAPQEDDSFLKNNQQIRRYDSNDGRKLKKYLIGIFSVMGIILLVSMNRMLSQSSLSKSSASGDETASSAIKTIIKEVYEYQHDFVREQGVLPSLESVTTKVTTFIPTRQNGTILLVTVQSTRPQCRTGKCVFRTYISGPTRQASYLHTHRELKPTSIENNQTYSKEFHMYEGGKYSVLVILEAFTNNTETALPITSSEIGFNASLGGHCLGARISMPTAHINVEMVTPELYMDPQMYRNTLSDCRYTAKDFGQNRFDWVNRKTLEAYQFSPENAMIVPLRRLDPTGNLMHFSANRLRNPLWIQPYQDFVWYPRNCIQRWVEPSEIRDLAIEQGKLRLVFVGTSRVLDTSTTTRSWLMSDTPPGFNAITDVALATNEMATSNPRVMMGILKKAFDSNRICMEAQRNDTNAPTLAIMLSHGIWEANYHDRVGGQFQFDKNAEASISFIKNRCAGRNYRLVLMTNPLVQNFDSRKDAFQVVNRYWNIPEPLMGTRIEAANWSWRKVAEKYNLFIVDGAGASFARRDANYDNVHYVLNDRRIHRRIPGRVGNEVSLTYSQLTMSALLQAFETSNPLAQS